MLTIAAGPYRLSLSLSIVPSRASRANQPSTRRGELSSLPSGSDHVLRGRRVREECRAKPLLTPLGVPPGIAFWPKACAKRKSDGRWRGESLAKSACNTGLVRNERWQGLPPPKAVPPCIIRLIGLHLSSHFASRATRTTTRMIDPSDRPTLNGDVEPLPYSITIRLRNSSDWFSRRPGDDQPDSTSQSAVLGSQGDGMPTVSDGIVLVHARDQVERVRSPGGGFNPSSVFRHVNQ